MEGQWKISLMCKSWPDKAFPFKLLKLVEVGQIYFYYCIQNKTSVESVKVGKTLESSKLS